MKQLLRVTSLLIALAICAPSTADIAFSIDFFEADTTTPLNQPIMIGGMFDMVVSVEDTLAVDTDGLTGYLQWEYDNTLLTQSIDLAPGPFNSIGFDWTNVGVPSFPTQSTSTGGEFNFISNTGGTFSNPSTLLTIQYTATDAGSAEFSLAGLDLPGAQDFAAQELVAGMPRSWGFDGACVATGCTGEVVSFGEGKVVVIPEPSSLALIVLSCLAFFRRR